MGQQAFVLERLAGDALETGGGVERTRVADDLQERHVLVAVRVRVGARKADAPALLPGALALAKSGVRTGASTRNWASYGHEVRSAGGLADWRRDLLTDPQTSGGLLVAVSPAESEAVLRLALSRGFAASRIVGRVVEGAVGLQVVAGANT